MPRVTRVGAGRDGCVYSRCARTHIEVGGECWTHLGRETLVLCVREIRDPQDRNSFLVIGSVDELVGPYTGRSDSSSFSPPSWLAPLSSVMTSAR